MSVGERLAKQREHNGFGVGAFAEACGVSREAQRRFERNVNLPGGAYLIAAAGLGVDIQYVLIGKRAQTPPASTQHVSADRGGIAAGRDVTFGSKPRRRK